MMKLPNMWTRVYMDNLFNSLKLYIAAYKVGALCQGVTRASGRGIPDGVVMTAELDPAKAEKRRGETHAAIYENDPNCHNLIAASVYDTKPVHMISTIAETVDWKVMQRKVWLPTQNSMVWMKYLRLGMIDEYNNFMNSVDWLTSCGTAIDLITGFAIGSGGGQSFCGRLVLVQPMHINHTRYCTRRNGKRVNMDYH
jgi:hypothetical protein